MKEKLIILIFLVIGFGAKGWAQKPTSSNYRKIWIKVSMVPQQLDVLSIVPNSFFIPGLDSNWYSIDFINAQFHWKKQPLVDSVQASFRVFSGKFNSVAQRMVFDTVLGKFKTQPLEFINAKQEENAIIDFGNLTYTGSFGRGLSFGNRQDVVVNSSLNLQLNGYLGDSIHLSAAISDNNIPIQPDGNTQNLNEFDQVYIQFYKDNWRLNVGDIDVRQNQGYFLNFYKRQQGISFETKQQFSKNASNKILASGAVAKGKFNRNVFQGLEGNQGPYRLQGANSELFFIILAGTERIFIDGELLQRGEDQDYVINYNTAEITFTPKRMITKDKRIQAEFEYADRNFLNAQLFLTDEIELGKKWKLSLSGFNNNDAKNSPINQTLDTRQKQFLSQLGDSIQQAFYPSARLDTFSSGKILYKKIDTSFYGKSDSVFVVSNNSQLNLYSLSFIRVDVGRGNYIIDFNTNANGKVYKWVSPDKDGNKQGDYEPAFLLVTPKKQQMYSFTLNYAGKQLNLQSEIAISNKDVNTFSSRDKQNDKGFAGKITLNHNKLLNSKKQLNLLTLASFEHTDLQFQPLERLRNVEFSRDWGLPLSLVPSSETIFSLGSTLKDNHQSLKNNISTYNRSNNFTAIRNNFEHSMDLKNWSIRNQVSFTKLSDITQKGYFFRPIVDINKVFNSFHNYQAGVKYSLEHNQLGNLKSDSLNPSSFSFSIWQLYLKSGDGPNKWGVSFYTRADQLPKGSKLMQVDKSLNYNLFADLMKNEHHQLRWNTSFRQLLADTNNQILSTKGNSTLLGRVEYFTNILNNAITGTMLYEKGAGQEPRRDFTYFEVPAGQGEYTWIDYNNDGLQQINEFELAKYRDQAKFIRVFTPTTTFIRANYLQFNYSLVINPGVKFVDENSKGIKRLISKIYLQSSLQLNKKNISNGLGDFNPLKNAFSDTSLLTLDQLLSNSFSYNRLSSLWGFDVNNIRTTGRAFLSYGYETRKLNDWTTKLRFNTSKLITWDVQYKHFLNRLLTPQFNNRNFTIEGNAIEPRLNFTQGTDFRMQISYKWDGRKNLEATEKSISNALIAEVKYNVVSNTSLASKFTVNSIKYNALPNATVSYIMLDGLLPGENYIWTVDVTKKLNRNIELSVQYEGRKAGISGFVHTGRAQVRAIF